MADTRYDCIVLGTGGVGSAALYHHARRGVRVLGLDQFPPGHDQGSSHGDSRIIRLAYFEHPDYIPLLRRAFELWRELEEQADTRLLLDSHVLNLGPADGEVITGLKAAASAHDLNIEPLSSAEVTRRFPSIRMAADQQAILDPNAGILKVEDCIRTYVSLAKRAGASLVVGSPVLSWRAVAQGIEVATQQDTYVCEKLVITPGAWASSLLPAIAQHFTIVRKALFWFDGDTSDFRLGDYPVVLSERAGDTFYAIPRMDAKGVKISNHSGGRECTAPERLDRTLDTTELEAASLFARHHLPSVGPQLNHHTTCMYTMSPDGHFLVGAYPGQANVYLAAGLSGHGFKFASVLGEILADLSTDGVTRHPIEFLNPLRFGGTNR